ncbi:MAG: hypothetical protein HQ485_03390 [Acidobacteria bacterium]|nr:hypothetical protein [Acidobacteriota bacterium]
MPIAPGATLRHVVAAVSSILKKRGITAVLTGGACASLYTRGAYLSYDLDYILRGTVTRDQLDRAMADIAFTRLGAQYQHPAVPFFVEFPPGPLAIGDDDLVEPVDIRVGNVRVSGLSATDSCRDRLAAFYFWNDEQSLRVAAEIARRQTVEIDTIRNWSRKEGHSRGFRRFEEEIGRG